MLVIEILSCGCEEVISIVYLKPRLSISWGRKGRESAAMGLTKFSWDIPALTPVAPFTNMV